jgi:hypothetical protein
MTTQITKTFGASGDYTTFAQLKAYIGSLDLIALDQNVIIRMSGEMVWPDGQSMAPLTADDNRRVSLMPAVGEGVNDLFRTTLDKGNSGASIRFQRLGSGTRPKGGLCIYGMRWIFDSDSSGNAAFLATGPLTGATAYDSIYAFNRIYINCTNGGEIIRLDGTNDVFRSLWLSNLIVVDGPGNVKVFGPIGAQKFYGNTFVAINGAVDNCTGIGIYAYAVNSNSFTNFAMPFDTNPYYDRIGSNFCNKTPTGGYTGPALTVVTGANSLLVNDATDYRPKAAGPLIGTAGVELRSSSDILGNNRGLTPDAGAWQLVAATPTPTGKITSTVISGQTVTVSGTTTNSPSSAVAELNTTSRTGNSGVVQTGVAVTLGSGTFTVTYSNCKVGEYIPKITFGNAGGNSDATDATLVEIAGATGVAQVYSVTGNALTISGTTAGSPVSGQLLIPPATTNPKGATTQTIALTLGSGTFSKTADLPPGNYAAGILTFTTSAGKSFPQPGTVPVSIIGISGSPQAPPVSGSGEPPVDPPSDTQAPALPNALVIGNITSSGFTPSWQAASDNTAVTGYDVSVDTGTPSFVNVGNVLTIPVTGKLSSTTYTVRVRAYDAAGNKSNVVTASATTAAPAGDTQDPVMSGSVTISAVSLNSFSASWQAGSDNVGVVSYEISVDTGTPSYTNIGNTLNYAATGLAPTTAYTVRVRAVDAVGRKSAPILGTATTQTPVQLDTENPVIPGALVITNITPTGCTVGWQAGTDNLGIAGYEVSVDTGTPSYSQAGMSLSKVVAGLLPQTTYTLRVRAFDAANNRSAPLTATFTTDAQQVGVLVPVIYKQANGVPTQVLLALPTSACTLSYLANGSQELVLFNRGNADVVVTLRGDAAGVINVKGAITKTLDLSTGLPITVPAGKFATLRLDAAAAYLKGNVTVAAATGGVVFAGVLQ